jgi:hypothetical protein
LIDGLDGKTILQEFYSLPFSDFSKNFHAPRRPELAPWIATPPKAAARDDGRDESTTSRWI